MKKMLLALFVLALGISLAGVAYAADGTTIHSVTGSMSVTTTVDWLCTVGAAPLDFVSYDGTEIPVGMGYDSTITVNCTEFTPYAISLDAGANLGAGISGTRAMGDGNLNYLSYLLYQDASGLTEWGDNGLTYSGARSPVEGTYTGTGIDQLYTAYGAITGGQIVPAGTYTDNVSVILDF